MRRDGAAATCNNKTTVPTSAVSSGTVSSGARTPGKKAAHRLDFFDRKSATFACCSIPCANLPFQRPHQERALVRMAGLGSCVSGPRAMTPGAVVSRPIRARYGLRPPIFSPFRIMVMHMRKTTAFEARAKDTCEPRCGCGGGGEHANYWWLVGVNRVEVHRKDQCLWANCKGKDVPFEIL